MSITGRPGPRGLHKETELERDIKWYLMGQHTFEFIAERLNVPLATVEAVAVKIIDGG